MFVRVIISPEKNLRKPVSILREEIKDFKLVKHIKPLVTDRIVQKSSVRQSTMWAALDFQAQGLVTLRDLVQHENDRHF